MPVAITAKRPKLARQIEREQFTVITALPAVDRDGNQIPGRFDAKLDERLLSHASRTPFLDGCRALIKLGFDPDAVVVMRHQGSAVDALRARIGGAAKLTVDEAGTPRFRQWKPFGNAAVDRKPNALSRGAVDAPSARTEKSDPPAIAELKTAAAPGGAL